MKESTMSEIAKEIWETAHTQNIHHLIKGIRGKSFRTCNDCILYVLTDTPETVKFVIRDIADFWDADMTTYEDGLELLFY
jgi:hypothetical protein